MGGQRYFTWPIQAGEDLDDLTPGSGPLFKAITIDDGKLANDSRMAGGLLLYGGKKGGYATIGYLGIMKFVAGENIGKGELLTVMEGGYLRKATDGDLVIGRYLGSDVLANHIGTGAFNFASPGKI